MVTGGAEVGRLSLGAVQLFLERAGREGTVVVGPGLTDG
ncbi:MAG: hypothetical protein BWY10_01166 [Chloroflexi bacterium ADurb.Bin180]|nr:MAG: hypothetical protein BWY10_01166 [Chloroflexi bacterium ADurb.Bin180]